MCVIGQSILLGYLTDYFTIQNPTDVDTRKAYLYALGRLHCILMLLISTYLSSLYDADITTSKCESLNSTELSIKKNHTTYSVESKVDLKNTIID